MITLYYKPGACSTANHFALEEAGVEYEAIRVNLSDLDDPLSDKVRKLNPMAMTPTIVLDDGTVLTQNAATLPFIADLAPEKNLFPARGTIERVLAESWLSFIASDLHPRMVEIVWVWAEENDAAKAKLRTFYDDRVALPLKVLKDRLADRPFILGDQYSVIDGYALIVLDWSVLGDLSLEDYPNILAFMERVASLPVIQHVRRLEGPLDWAFDHEDMVSGAEN
ncbi:glutathione S-transferase family protein [Chelativorans sp. YIM 93263]|uniref:glutathione S-transferase family protein n=1 Tax=Chelativorans sp. YIM 93263 TaxID=2906648 RepID=UPI002379DFA4|nr:glutathione S-transferase family protein [Chelativorans sp. YIM 93263]